MGVNAFEALPDAFELVCVPSELVAAPVVDGLVLFVDDEPEEPDEPDEPEGEELDDELELDGSASATPGMVATAVPTPSATANAPTRPT